MTGTSWQTRLVEALNRGVSPEPLAIAEQALREDPTDAELLHLGALAALVAGKPDRCPHYLKRMGKRYKLLPDDHLLRALAFASEGHGEPERQILVSQRLTDPRVVVRCFRGGPSLRPWLFSLLRRAYEPAFQARPAPVKAKPAARPARSARKKETPKPAVAPASASVPELPRLRPAIPLEIGWVNREAIVFEGSPEADAARFRLRGDLARLALLQGFDELLCLSQVQGVESYWYQVKACPKCGREVSS